MDKVTIEIFTGNDAFIMGNDLEVGRILRDLASNIERGYYPSFLFDRNGNKAGTVNKQENCRCCDTCKHEDKNSEVEPCRDCFDNYSNWEGKDIEKETN